MQSDIIVVNDHLLDFVRIPLYAEAHPEEPCDFGERCEKCIVARRRDTGETVLLWLVGGKHYAVSRHEPEYEKHKHELQ